MGSYSNLYDQVDLISKVNDIYNSPHELDTYEKCKIIELFMNDVIDYAKLSSQRKYTLNFSMTLNRYIDMFVYNEYKMNAAAEFLNEQFPLIIDRISVEKRDDKFRMLIDINVPETEKK